MLVISDGAAGLIAAIEAVFPQALRQRCLIHRLRNIEAKIPTGMQAEIRDGFWALFDTTDLDIPPGPRLVQAVDARIAAFADTYGPTYPAALKILRTDAAGLTAYGLAYLRFPAEHHQRIRHSNLIERTFGETRRRTKVIGRFPGEASCISLAWAVLDRAAAGWRGLTMTPAGLRHLQDLRRSLLDPPRELHPRNATTTDPPDDVPGVVGATAWHHHRGRNRSPIYTGIRTPPPMVELAVEASSRRVERERIELALGALENPDSTATFGHCRSIVTHDGVRACGQLSERDRADRDLVWQVVRGEPVPENDDIRVDQTASQFSGH